MSDAISQPLSGLSLPAPAKSEPGQAEAGVTGPSEAEIAQRWQVGAIGAPAAVAVVDVEEEVGVDRVPVYATRPRSLPCPVTAQRCLDPSTGWVWLVAGQHLESEGAAPLVPASGLSLVGEWPNPELGWPSLVVVTCEAAPASVAAAAELVRAWASGSAPDHVEVVALAVIHAARPSRASRRAAAEAGPALAALAGAVSDVVEIHQADGTRRRGSPVNDEPAAIARITALLDLVELHPRKETR